VRGRLALIDGRSGATCHEVAFQYNPDRLLHTLHAPAGGDPRARPLETLVLSADLDAADGLQTRDPIAVELGIAHRVAAFRALLRPPAQCADPFVVLTLGPWRAVPVHVVELAIAEQAFDAQLHPIRAIVTLTLVVLDARAAAPAAARALEAYDEVQDRLAAIGAASEPAG